MNNQDNNFHLNPTAREFVPTFGGATFAAAPTSTLNNQEFEPVQEQQPQRHYQQQHYNNNYNNNYSKPHYNSGGRGGGRGRGGYNNHYNGHRGGHNQYDNHRSHYSNDPNIDPLEMEARCEAVIEILQDDKIRNVINPNYDNQDSHPGSVTNAEENVESQFDDEEDLLEMMAMQEECRLEMMKFYIQSQNPSLFENVYHGVSYPENHPANAPPSSAPPASDPSHQTTAPSFPAPSSVPVSSAPPTNNNSNNNTSSSVKDQIINDLSINAPEFDPTQLAGLSLNDK